MPNRCTFHRVDPRLRVLKEQPSCRTGHTAFVSSRRPEVEGTESVISPNTYAINISVSSRRPEVEGTESLNKAVNSASFNGFHRVDPRLRVLKVLLVLRLRYQRPLVSSRRPEVEGTERYSVVGVVSLSACVSSRRPEVEGTESGGYAT